MEQVSSNSLKYISINQATTEALKYIDDRRRGVSKSLKTRYDKLNYACLGGLEPNSIYTIGGISGSGKSSFANLLETDIIDLNPEEDIIILNFNFEMLAAKQVGRKLSNKLKMTTSELYSGRKTLSYSEYNKIEETSKSIRNYPIYYADKAGTVDQIEATVLKFMQNEAKGKWLIIMLDHTILTKKKQGEDERRTLQELQNLWIELKKYGRNTIIQLTQLNRNIEETERIKNVSMHYPSRIDLFGGDSVYQASDVVMILHRPELLLGTMSYGPNNFPTKDLVYLHLIKVREGELGLVLLEQNLKHNELIETTFDEYNLKHPQK